MASIKRIEGKGGASYKITVSMGRDVRGKQKRHYMTYRPDPGLTARQMERKVKQVAVEFEKQIEYGFRADDQQTFEQYAHHAIKVKEGSGCARSSVDSFLCWLEIVSPFIGKKKMRDIRPQHIRELYQELSKPGMRRKAGQATPIVDFKSLIKEQYGTQLRFAEIVDVSKSTMLQVYQGKHIGHQSAVKVAEAIGRPLSELFAVDMQDNETISPNTIIGIHSFLSVIFKQAEMDMVINTNPVERVQPPRKGIAKRNFFQPDQIQQIMDAAEQEPIMWRTMIHLFVVSGARRGEILALKWENVDFDLRQIKIDSCITYSPHQGLTDGPTKTRNTRCIPLPEESFAILRKFRLWQLERRFLYGDQWQESPYVFTGERGGVIYPTSVNAWFDKFAARHNLPHINPHAFRHSAASIMISEGVDIVAVSEMLGHATSKTTMEVYAHAIEASKRNAAECIADTILRKKA